MHKLEKHALAKNLPLSTDTILKFIKHTDSKEDSTGTDLPSCQNKQSLMDTARNEEEFL